MKLYDEKTHRYDVKRCLAEANLVRGDLLEILAQWPEEEQSSKLRNRIALATLELLVPLTWPLELDESTTANNLRHAPYLQLAMVGYKRAVLNHDTAKILHAAIRVGVPAMATPRRDRSKRDEGVISIILYLFRNIAMIQQPPELPSQGDENDISRSVVLQQFSEQDVLQLLLTISSSIGDEFVEQDVVIIEVLFHLLKGIDPSSLWKEKKQLADEQTRELRSLLAKEKAMFAGYKRHAPSRHNRFGTMLWVKRGDDKLNTMTGQDVITSEQHTLDKMDKSKQWNKPKPRRKQVEGEDEYKDFGTEIQVDGPARRALRGFVEDFLDSGFNPLFNHVRRAIESERDRVMLIHSRQYFYLMSWFLQAEAARQKFRKAHTDAAKTADETSFAYIASVMTQENFILLNRTMQKSMDDKSWKDVHATIMAFTQILHTVTAMTESPSEDDQEIAENIQNRIFYEETTHDRVIAILRGYKDQGFPYLDAVTELAHTFLRTLERYSKQNSDIYIRSKRRARKKRKAADVPQSNANDDGANDAASEAEDEYEAQRVVSERKFEFPKFSARFMTQPCINTFVRFTAYYHDLRPEQLKRAHRFFYRCAFKMDLSLYLFRVDILNMFNRMIKGPNGLDRERVGKEVWKDWEELVRQIFRKCLKRTEERRELVVEMLFSKIPATVFYLEHGYDREIVKKAPRPPAELEVKPGLEHDQAIGVAVSVLVNQGKLDELAWVKTVLMDAIPERQAAQEEQEAWSQQQEALEPPTSDPSDPSKPAIPSILVKPDNPDRRTSLSKDKHLRLLLTLLSFERLGLPSDPSAPWTIPSTLTTDALNTSLDLIRKHEFDPPTYEEGKPAESFIRAKSAARPRKENEMSSDEDSGGDEIDEALFAPGGPTPFQRGPDDPAAPAKPARKRKLQRKDEGEEISEAERKRRAEERKKREKEKNAKIKSRLFVTESDDESDEEKDAEFFRLEEERRRNMKGAIKSALLKTAAEMEGAEKEARGKAKGKAKGKGKRPVGLEALLDSDLDDESEVETPKPKKRKRKQAIFEEESDEENEAGLDNDPMEISSDSSSSDGGDSPMRMSSNEVEDEEGGASSSPQQRGNSAEASEGALDRTLTETSGNAAGGGEKNKADESDEEDVLPVSKPARRRGPFVIDDSDSE